MPDNCLAIEWSSSRISVAWQRGTETDPEIGEEVLELKRFQAEQALPMLGKVVADFSEIREIRIGRGPGNYSGIRQSLAWAFGYCAPGNIRLRTCASGQAQAFRLQGQVEGPFAILGDARRGLWWGAIFPEDHAEWRLQSPEAWTKEIGEMPVFSQEAARLKSAAFEVVYDAPTARDLLQLPENALCEDTLPLYLHPAV